jgi:hypothetical protein
MKATGAARWSVRDSRTEHDWVRAHTALTRIARERAAADAEEAEWLLVAWRSRAHAHLGYGSFSEYIERLLGYSPRATREKLRVAEVLATLPQATRALARGRLSWCAARELTRVATPDTESAWLDAAHGKTTRQLERMVAGRRPGELPPQPGDPEAPRRHVLHFDVSPETFATFRQAMQTLRRAAGGNLEDDALLLAMARHTLGAPAEGRSMHRITYEMCPICGRGAQLAVGERVPVADDVLNMAACDGEHIDVPSRQPANENRAPNATEPDGVPSNPMTHMGRARQAVPPALRRAVLLRDHHRCCVPGCTNTHHVDVHHIRPRAEGGRNTIENLITLCTAHHRATHRGDLAVEGSAAELRVRHADGTPYGDAVVAESAEAYAKVFAGLRHLGFREREVNAVLAELRADAALHHASTQVLLREALCRVRGPCNGN